MAFATTSDLSLRTIHVLVVGQDSLATSQVAARLEAMGGFVTSMPEAPSLPVGALGTTGGRAMLLVVGSPRGAAMMALCADAREANVPVAAIADSSDVPDGVHAAGSDAAPDEVAGFLRGIMARQSVVRDLGDQLSRATQQDAPLRSEMNRLQDELSLAASVQREFLPRALPRVGDWTTAALWRPASYVSGDIYNAFRADEHHLAIFIVDAVGHGVPAALLTLVLARAMPIKKIEPGHYRLYTPAESLRLLNREMVQYTGRHARFATAAYALVDLRTGRTRVATAGHPAVLKIGAGGTMAPVESSGPILGILEDAEFEEREVEVGPGEGLMLYTDGFEHLYPKAHPTIAGAMLPTDQFLSLFQDAAARGQATAIAAHVEEAIDRAKGGLPLIDDVTLVVATRS